jgi:5-methylcytosine-specific restriction endonuclease McrA
MPAKNRPDLKTPEWKAITKVVLERFGYQCVACPAEATTVDHIIPHSLGGTSDLSNLQAMCNRCNGAKGNKVQFRNNWTNPRWGVRLS